MVQGGTPKVVEIARKKKKEGEIQMILDALTLEDVEQVRIWRNSDLTPWRTPYLLTREMQIMFYQDIISKRNAPHRYWAIKKKLGGFAFTDENDPDYSRTTTKQIMTLIGMGGLTDISIENRNAEITLIIDPDLAGKGCGEEAVEMIYSMAFNYLNLVTVYGEVYWCNEKGVNFWNKIIRKYNGYTTRLPNRKYWEGQYYDSSYFDITKERFNGTMRKMRDAKYSPNDDAVYKGYMPSVSELQEKIKNQLVGATETLKETV